MKHILFISLLFWWSDCCCKEIVKLRGKITNPITDSISVTCERTSTISWPDEYHIKLRKDGSFSFQFSVLEGFTEVRIGHGDKETHLFVQSGADLALTLNAKNFDSSIHYEGKGKQLANFMAKYQLMPDLEQQGQMLCSKEPKEFESGLKKLEENELDFLQKNGAYLPNGFAEYFKIDTRYRVYSIMELYLPYHAMKTQRNIKDLPKEDFAVIDDIPEAFNDDYIDRQSYQSYLTNYLSTRIAGELADLNLPGEAWPSTDSTINRAFNMMPRKTAEYYIGEKIAGKIKDWSMEKCEEELSVYNSRFPNSKNLPVLEEKINRKRTYASGQPAIDFDITTPEGKQMKLSDLKGNVVYIDFWASWCKGCVAEMPASKKVRAYFKDKPVRFLYVSIDTYDASWKKAMKQYEVEGINMRLENDTESPTAKKYNVKGIPVFYLIDKEGNFASSDDLARPGDTEKLIAQIEKLLN